MTSKSTGRKATQKWTPNEVAFLFVYLEFCKRNNIDYTATISDEITRFAKRDLSSRAVDTKLKKVLLENGKTGNAASVQQLCNEGISYLNMETLPAPVLEQVKHLHEDWKLGVINIRQTAKSSTMARDATTLNNTHTFAPHMPRATTLVDGNKRKTYSEDTILGSDEIMGDNFSNDGDWEEETQEQPSEDVPEQPPKKKQRASPTIAVSQPKNQGVSTVPVSTAHDTDCAVSTEICTENMTPTCSEHTLEHQTSQDSVALIRRSLSPGHVEATVQPAKRSHIVNNGLAAHSTRQPAVASQKVPAQMPGHGSMQHERALPVPPLIDVTKEQHSRMYQQPFTHTPLLLRAHNSSPTLSTAEDKTTSDKVDALCNIVAYVLQQIEKSEHGQSTEKEDRVRSVLKGIGQIPGQPFGQMLKDLEARDRAYENVSSTLRKLIGHQQFNKEPKFPEIPSAEYLDKGWKAMHKHIKDAFGYTFPPEPRPTAVAAGFLAARIDDLTNHKPYPLAKCGPYIRELRRYLDSPHSVRAFLSAMFCRWLFGEPERLWKAAYSSKELKLYEALLVDRGVAEVQHMDKVSMKLLFEDEDFNNGPLKTRTDKLLTTMANILKLLWPNARGFDQLNNPYKWITSAIKTKQILMLSPKDYRVHFFHPATTFDSELMQAEDSQGFPISDDVAVNSRILTCLFPALAQQDAAPFEENPRLDDVLVCNKKFFLTFDEKISLDPKMVISKAIVLLG